MKPREQIIKKSPFTPTFLIAGGAGFIGSHLAEKLLEQDARVIVLDNFKTGKDIYVNSLLNNPKFALFDADINQGIPKNVESVDYIIHLAGVESYLYSRDQVNLDSLLTNALGTKNLLDLAQKSDAKFLLVSSIDVYEGLISPISLDQYFGKTPEEEKRYSLGEAKRFAEALVWEFYKKNQTNVRIVRVPEVYGPRMNLAASGALGRFLKEILDNKSITVYGDGAEKEYYLYISDVVNGIVRALLNQGTTGQIFTLANENPTAVIETAYLVKSLANAGTQVIFKEAPSAFMLKTSKIPDRGNLNILKWDPKVSMKEGVKNTLNYFGHEPNEYSFKPAKLLENRLAEIDLKNGKKLDSIVGNPGETEEHHEEELFSIANWEEKPKQITNPERILPKPKVPLQLPKIKPWKLPTFTIPSAIKNLTVKVPKQNMAIAIAIITVFTIFSLVPLIQTYFYTKAGVENLEKTATYLMQLDSAKSKEFSNAAFQNFYKAQRAFSKDKWLFSLFGQNDKYNSISSLLSSTTYFSKGTYNISKGAQPFTKIWEIIKPNTQAQFNKDEFSTAQVNFNEAKNNLQRAEGAIKNVNPTHIPEKYRPQLDEYKTKLQLLTTNLDTTALLASEIPNLLGAEDKMKRYMILFQNSNEIRPTGGFIGSYAILETQNGKISSLTIDDIYNPDGQIDVKDVQTPKPPAVIEEMLNEEKLYIRNANWNPDFNKSAETIMGLYSQVTNTQLDGVMAVDLNFVENILRVTGPIYLTAFSEEISADNLYERTQFHSEFNYQNGSDQKRAFLTILGSKLLESIFAISSDKMPTMFMEIDKALQERHLLIHLANSAFGAELQRQGWDGGLIGVSPESSDYLQVVNANIGGTKANYYVQNDMQYKISSKTRDGLLRAELVLSYKHTGTDNSWPGGPYKNYVRAVVQKGSNLTGATLNVFGSGVAEGTESTARDIMKEIIIDKVGDYTSFEQLIEVLPQQTATLTLYYDLPQSLTITKDKAEYNLYWQKQAGTAKDSFTFGFVPPFGMTLESNSEVRGSFDRDFVYSTRLK